MAKNSLPESITKQLQEQFPKLGGNEARRIVQIVSQKINIRSGPYPVPEDYDYYHEIDPDLTDQMKKMVLDEQKHQHNLDLKFLEKDFGLKKRGQIAALLLSVLALGGGFYTVLQGFEAGGTIIASIGLSGIIAQFLKKR